MGYNKTEDVMLTNDVCIDSFAAYSLSAQGANAHYRNILVPRGLHIADIQCIHSSETVEFNFIHPPRPIFVIVIDGVNVLLDMDPMSSTDGPGPVVCIRYREQPNTTILALPLFFFRENGSVGISYADAIDGQCASLQTGQEVLGWHKRDLRLHIIWKGYKGRAFPMTLSKNISKKALVRLVWRCLNKFFKDPPAISNEEDPTWALDNGGGYLAEGDHSRRFGIHDILLVGVVQLTAGSIMPLLQFSRTDLFPAEPRDSDMPRILRLD